MIVQCCVCKGILGERPGGRPGDVTHTYCQKCYIKTLKSIWELKHIASTEGKYYHPWATDSGKFIAFESEPYRGGVIFQRVSEFQSAEDAGNFCREKNSHGL